MRTVALAILATAVIALTGCSSTCDSTGCGTPACGVSAFHNPGCDTDIRRALPSDLPANPDPTKKYCKVWVPPVTRQVPKLVQVEPGGMKCETITVMETCAREVEVKPAECRSVKGCDTRCDDTAVLVKPGGYRWEKVCGCWKYVYHKPEYKWCDKTIKEEGLKYCYKTCPEYKTVVTSRPVKRVRRTYVPAKYKVAYECETFRPGHYEWQAKQSCGKPDSRQAQQFVTRKDRRRDCPKPRALDCGCPTTN